MVTPCPHVLLHGDLKPRKENNERNYFDANVFRMTRLPNMHIPITPLRNGAIWIRNFNIVGRTLRQHAFILFNCSNKTESSISVRIDCDFRTTWQTITDCNVWAFLSASMLDKCTCSHRNANATCHRARWPFCPRCGTANTNSFTSTIHICFTQAQILFAIVIIVRAAMINFERFFVHLRSEKIASIPTCIHWLRPRTFLC